MGHLGREVAMIAKQKQVIVLRIAGPPGAAGIHELRALLKALLRRHKFRALDVREEHDAPQDDHQSHSNLGE
jgi:hypothetical protein